MRVSRRGVREEPYWEPPFKERGARESRSSDETASEVRQAVTRAVRRRMEENPPIALSLSSGVDSTIVCGLMAEEARRAGRPLTAFSVGYDGAAYDESAAAERTAAHFGVGFERVSCTPALLADNFLEAIHSIEVPTNSLSATARIQLTGAVRRAGLKALMSGEGSDELFGGYPYFGLEAIWRGLGESGPGRAHAEAAWQSFRVTEAGSRGIFWDDSQSHRTTPPLFGYPSVYHLRALRMQRDVPRLFSRQWLSRMGETPLAVAGREFDLDWLRSLAPFDATRAIARGMLGSVIIPGLGDRVEMASSLEGRVPYLDLDVINLACSLPQEHCIEPRTFARKHVLRRAFADLLPPGHSAPAKTTLMAPGFADLAQTAAGRGLFDALLSDRAVRAAGVFDPTFVKLLRAAWKLWPGRGRRHAQMDLLVGYMMCTQALHHVLIEDGLGKRASLPLLALDEDRTPPAAPRPAARSREDAMAGAA
jgi:asparagine synthase (glutamine-hydrolysing)